MLRMALWVLLAIATVTLGLIGYRHRGFNYSESLYRTMQLFFLKFSAQANGAPWQLDVARFLALFVIGFAAIAAMLALARNRTQQLHARFRARDHLLIVGLGRRGTAIARRARDEGQRVVAVDRDETDGGVIALRARGIPVLIGDGRDPAVMLLARITAASQILLVASEDSTNLEVLATCNRILSKSTRRHTRIYVTIEDLGLWACLHRRALSHDGPGAHAEFISIADLVARRLVDRARSATEEQLTACDVAIYASGPVGVRLVVHALRLVLPFQPHPTIKLRGPASATLEAALHDHEPWVMATADVVTEDEERPTAPQLGFVAGFNEADSLAIAPKLVDDVGANGAVFVAVPDADTEHALRSTPYNFERIHLVAAESEALSPRLFTESSLELIARAKHEDYLSAEHARGITAEKNTSLKSWDELPEVLRESNRHFAESIAGKLGHLNASLVPLTSATPKDLPLTPDELEDLAEMEHERWARDQEADGWRFTSGQKDPDRKLHPSLIPWDELPEIEKEKDREAIRSMATILGKIGYQIHVPNRENTHA